MGRAFGWQPATMGRVVRQGQPPHLRWKRHSLNDLKNVVTNNWSVLYFSNIALVRAGGFSTYSEVSDNIFKDFTGACLDLGNGEQNGIAEEMVARNRFYRCGSDAIASGITTRSIFGSGTTILKTM
jgi:hypothetical protein